MPRCRSRSPSSSSGSSPRSRSSSSCSRPNGGLGGDCNLLADERFGLEPDEEEGYALPSRAFSSQNTQADVRQYHGGKQRGKKSKGSLAFPQLEWRSHEVTFDIHRGVFHLVAAGDSPIAPPSLISSCSEDGSGNEEEQQLAEAEEEGGGEGRHETREGLREGTGGGDAQRDSVSAVQEGETERRAQETGQSEEGAHKDARESSDATEKTAPPASGNAGETAVVSSAGPRSAASLAEETPGHADAGLGQLEKATTSSLPEQEGRGEQVGGEEEGAQDAGDEREEREKDTRVEVPSEGMKRGKREGGEEGGNCEQEDTQAAGETHGSGDSSEGTQAGETPPQEGNKEERGAAELVGRAEDGGGSRTKTPGELGDGARAEADEEGKAKVEEAEEEKKKEKEETEEAEKAAEAAEEGHGKGGDKEAQNRMPPSDEEDRAGPRVGGGEGEGGGGLGTAEKGQEEAASGVSGDGGGEEVRSSPVGTSVPSQGGEDLGKGKGEGEGEGDSPPASDDAVRSAIAPRSGPNEALVGGGSLGPAGSVKIDGKRTRPRKRGVRRRKQGEHGAPKWRGEVVSVEGTVLMLRVPVVKSRQRQRQEDRASSGDGEGKAASEEDEGEEEEEEEEKEEEEEEEEEKEEEESKAESKVGCSNPSNGRRRRRESDRAEGLPGRYTNELKDVEGGVLG